MQLSQAAREPSRRGDAVGPDRRDAVGRVRHPRPRSARPADTATQPGFGDRGLRVGRWRRYRKARGMSLLACATGGWKDESARPVAGLDRERGAKDMTGLGDYTPPKVWVWDKASGGRFANINRPVAGPTHDKELPVGRHPLQLYSLGTPNGQKVTILLEELLALGHGGAEYDAWLIRIGDGEQFGSGFVDVNPNSKIPALLDRSGPEPIRVFESGAILLHLAEKFGAFIPTDPAGARRMPVLAVLADGQHALSRRRLRPLLCLCPDQVRIRDRPLRHGGEAAAGRARPAARRKPLSGRRTIIRSRISRSSPGMAAL